jgi:hypothetical protein
LIKSQLHWRKKMCSCTDNKVHRSSK